MTCRAANERYNKFFLAITVKKAAIELSWLSQKNNIRIKIINVAFNMKVLVKLRHYITEFEIQNII